MDESWDSQSASPEVKFEASPAESFLSMPGEVYPSLFATTPVSTTMNPLEIMTPQSFTDETKGDMSALASGLTATPATPTTDKKPAKKRKSWGQVLPEPKTNLPPRKRAKTEDEKEQRRVERVLRNRRAAQSSRERKRLEVEALERRNKDLELALANAQKANRILFEELSKVHPSASVAAQNAVTFSQELFSSHDGHNAFVGQAKSSLGSLGDLLVSHQSQSTINPTSLSPALSPVPDDDEEEDETAEAAATHEDANNHDETEQPTVDVVAALRTLPDLTQHPAEVLCRHDLQCQSARDSAATSAPQPAPLSLFWQLTLLLSCTSTMLSLCQRPLTKIALSLKAGFSLAPTPALLNTIVWLVTRPSPSRTPTLTLTNSSTTNHTSPPAAVPPTAQPTNLFSTTLRLKLLRKILTRSPMLARPLMDATVAALRLVRSEDTLDVDRVGGAVGSSAGPEAAWTVPDGAAWPHGATLPSKELLLTLLWVLKVEEQKRASRQDRISPPPPPISPGISSSSSVVKNSSLPALYKEMYVLKIHGKRRRAMMEKGHNSDAVRGKRARLE